MKKLMALLLALAMCFSLIACGESKEIDTDRETQEQTTKPKATKPAKTEPEETEPVPESISTPLLYKVTDFDGDVIWLFGSIHVGIEDYYPLPDYVLDAFYGSDGLAVEFDLVAFEKDLVGQVKALQALVYADGTTIKDHIPQELYERTIEIAKEYDSYNKAFEYYVPMMWVSLLDMILVELTEVDPSLGVDRHMINLAYECDKPVLDVESAEFQYGLMAGFSEELQAFMLQQSVNSFDTAAEYTAQLEEMVAVWMQGNEAEFAAMISEETAFDTDREAALYAEYNDALVCERNLSMTEYAVDALENGEELFICVGAAHIVGAGAMAENLRELGYTVEIVR